MQNDEAGNVLPLSCSEKCRTQGCTPGGRRCIFVRILTSLLFALLVGVAITSILVKYALTTMSEPAESIARQDDDDGTAIQPSTPQFEGTLSDIASADAIVDAMVAELRFNGYRAPRSNFRCGTRHGHSGCNRRGPYPCCSPSGHCGATELHCKGPGAHDHRLDLAVPVQVPTLSPTVSVTVLEQRQRAALNAALVGAAGVYRRDSAKRRPELEKVVVVTAATEAYWPLLSNLLCWCDQHAISLVVLALDDLLYQRLALQRGGSAASTPRWCNATARSNATEGGRLGHQSQVVRFTVPRAVSSQSHFKATVQTKLSAALEVLQMGLDLVFVDSDVSFPRDPFPLLFPSPNVGRAQGTTANAMSLSLDDQLIISDPDGDEAVRHERVLSILAKRTSSMTYSILYQVHLATESCPTSVSPTKCNATATATAKDCWSSATHAEGDLNSGFLVVRSEPSTLAIWRAAIANERPERGDGGLIWEALQHEVARGMLRFESACSRPLAGVEVAVNGGGGGRAGIPAVCALDPFLFATGWRVGASGQNGWCNEGERVVPFGRRCGSARAFGGTSGTKLRWPPPPAVVHASAFKTSLSSTMLVDVKVKALRDAGFWCSVV